MREVLLSKSWGVIVAVATALQLVIFACVILGGAIVARIFAHRRLVDPPRVVRATIRAAVVTVVLNALTTIVGIALVRRGILVVRDDTGWRAFLDVPILLLAMDAAMYALHRVAHVARIYPLAHRMHHAAVHPRAIDLFVLSPFENLGFGALWLAVIVVYPASWLGMSIYLAINAAMGGVGHLGVEPLPDRWVRVPVVRWIATSTFHAQHHAEGSTNFGFYTVVFDRIFGTLSPRYLSAFGRPIVSADATSPTNDAAHTRHREVPPARAW